jgi:hypothetical protein
VSDEFGSIEKIINDIIVELNQKNTHGVINKKKQKKLLGILKPNSIDFYGVEMGGISYKSENKKQGKIEKLCKKLEKELDNLDNAKSE